MNTALSTSKKIMTQQHFKIKLISAKDTYAVRHPILRKGKPVETCAFNGDNLKSTFHLGLYNTNTLIGVASFMKAPNNLFDNATQYQLRGMAILKSFQGKNLGHTLLAYGENLLKQNHCNLVWCNARIVALNFYKRNGYKTIGNVFNIPEVGEHYTMYKLLT